jgi:hypothetical protein
MKLADRPSLTASIEIMKAHEERAKAENEAIKRGEPIWAMEVKCPLRVAVSHKD